MNSAVENAAPSNNHANGGQASLSASDLENLIEGERLAMIYAQGVDCRRYHFQRMRALIAQRTPETIERMERERGLR